MADSIFEQFFNGDTRALARLITWVERDSSQSVEVMKQIYPFTGKAHIIGVTGPPGAGKSTIVDKLISIIRREGFSVGVVAVDPSSPCSGGAVLGDRIRMQHHTEDEKVFIRSMATRGNAGGLPKSCRNIISLMDAFGKDYIIVETVGVGQTELSVMEVADTTIVVLVPESGDSIQAMKAGILEIADIFVINKADRPGADIIAVDLEFIIERNQAHEWWNIPILQTQAANNVGIEDLFGKIQLHYGALKESGGLQLRRQGQKKEEFLKILTHRIMGKVDEIVSHNSQLSGYIEAVEKGRLDPYSASEIILSNIALNIMADNP